MPDDHAEKTLFHHDVFISYAQEDKIVADTVCAKLESRNIRCWIAPRDVHPGTNFPEAIIDGIDGGQLMLLIFSSHANNSPHVIRELTNAVNKGQIIIPFRIEDVVPSKSMEYLISVPHWLDAVTPPLEKHIEVLIKTIDCIIGSDKTPAACITQATMTVEQKPAVAPPPPPPPSPVPAVPEIPKPEKTPVILPKQPDAVPFRLSKRIVIAGIVFIALVIAIFGMYGGVIPLPIPIMASSHENVTNVSHPGISDTDYYRSSEARVNTVVLTAAPTETMAKDTELFVDVNKDSSNALVTVQFNGGPGEGLIQDNRVLLTRSDGTTTEGKLNYNKRLSEVELQGTRGTDRIQVFVTLHSGEVKCIIDRLLPYRQYR
jgi:hypothetical protein